MATNLKEALQAYNCEEKIRTHFTNLDEILNGGLSKNDITIFDGSPFLVYAFAANMMIHLSSYEDTKMNILLVTDNVERWIKIFNTLKADIEEYNKEYNESLKFLFEHINICDFEEFKYEKDYTITEDILFMDDAPQTCQGTKTILYIKEQNKPIVLLYTSKGMTAFSETYQEKKDFYLELANGYFELDWNDETSIDEYNSEALYLIDCFYNSFYEIDTQLMHFAIQDARIMNVETQTEQ